MTPLPSSGETVGVGNKNAQHTGFIRRVLVVDDEPMLRMLLSETLAGHGFEVQTAENALDAKRAVRRFDPDVLVVDLDLGEGLSGVDLITAISLANPGLGFVLLSNYSPTPEDVANARRLLYLNKRDVGDIGGVIDAINRVLGVDDSHTLNQQSTNSLLGDLTRSQRELLALIAEGLTNDEIARRRGVEIRSVQQSVYRLYQALGLRRGGSINPRTAAAGVYAASFGLRQPG